VIDLQGTRRHSGPESIRIFTRSAPPQTFSTEVNWIGASSLAEALGAHQRTPRAHDEAPPPG